MARSQRRGLAFLTFLISLATVAVAIAAIGYFHPDKNTSWVWYGSGSNHAGMFFGTRKASICALGTCKVYKISELNDKTDEQIESLDDMAKAGDAAFYGTIIGVIFLAIFTIWMLMATVGGKHAHVHGRHCSLLAAVAFGLAFGIWLAYRPHSNKFKEGDAFWAIVVACGLSVICYIMSHYLSGGQRHGYTRV